jgi:hypothetical protein
MQDYRTNQPAFDAQDPEGTRLTREAVIAINEAHRDGTGWDAIARQHRTSRKNVQRIVQGRRWRDLHPNVRPDLYVDGAERESPADPVEAIVNDALREARDRIVRELRGA